MLSAADEMKSNIPDTSRQDASLLICIVLYMFALVYALIQSLLRHWMERNSTKIFEHYNHAATLIVSPETRKRILYIPQNFALAIALRLVWFIVKYENYAPKPAPGKPACHNYHTLLSACNRLSQLLFFTAFASIVTFWIESIQKVSILQLDAREQESLSEIEQLLAYSTLRRDYGSRVAQVPNVTTPNSALIESRFFTPNRIQILVNFWAYAIMVILLVVQWFECDNKLYEIIYDGETVCIALLFAILTIAYLYHGGIVYLRLISLGTANGKVLARYTLIIIASCILVFPIRVLLFSLRPIFNITLHGLAYGITYPWFFYVIPELFPAFVILTVMTPSESNEVFREDTDDNVSEYVSLESNTMSNSQSSQEENGAA